MIGAVLAGVEDGDLSEVAEGQAAIDRGLGSDRERFGTEREVLVERLVGGGAAGEEEVDRRVVLGDAGGVVVFDLVVVPGRDPGEGGVGGLEIGIGFVEGVAEPVVGKGLCLAAEVGAAADGVFGADAFVLVDVVAEEEDEVEVVLDQVAVGRVVAGLIVLAGGEGKAEAVERGIGRWGGFGAADGADLGAGDEAVVVLATGFEPLDVDVDAVAEFRCGNGGAVLDDGAEGLVAGDFPLDFDGSGIVAAETVFGEGIGGEAGPENDAGRKGIAGSDAEGEWGGAGNGAGNGS